jgi:hypothetical protein
MKCVLESGAAPEFPAVRSLSFSDVGPKPVGLGRGVTIGEAVAVYEGPEAGLRERYSLGRPETL